MANIQRDYLTAIQIEAGIITLIRPDGNIDCYRQRGINQIDNNLKIKLIRAGCLNPNWSKYTELPRNWSISFEDEEIMGHAYATFQLPKGLRQPPQSKKQTARGSK